MKKRQGRVKGGHPQSHTVSGFSSLLPLPGYSLGESVQGGVKTGKGKGREKGQHIGMGVPKVLLTFHSLLPALVGSQAILPGQSHWKRKGSHA